MRREPRGGVLSLTAPAEEATTMRIQPIETGQHPPAIATAAATATVEQAEPRNTPEFRAIRLLGDAAGRLDETLHLVVTPAKPGFHGPTPAQQAAQTLATANALLVDALAAIRQAGGALHPVVVDHATHALAAGGEARELLHELIDAGAAGDPQALRAVTGAIEQTLAHTRMAIATAIGEP